MLVLGIFLDALTSVIEVRSLSRTQTSSESACSGVPFPSSKHWGVRWAAMPTQQLGGLWGSELKQVL